GKHDSVDAKRGNGEDVENADVDIGNYHRHPEEGTAKGNYRDGCDCRHHRQTRRKPVIEPVYVSGSVVFFQEKLHRISNWLKQSSRADAIWSKPVLYQRAHSPLGINGIRNHRQNDEKDDGQDLEHRADAEK